MDSTFVGVIGVCIGAAVSFFTTWLSQLMAMRKEEKQWRRQQEAEERKWARDQESDAGKRVYDTYSNCIRVLSTLVSAGSIEEPEAAIGDEERFRLYQEAHQWLTALSLYHGVSGDDRVSAFHRRFAWFTQSPDSVEAAEDLRSSVIELAMKEKVLFPDMRPKTEEPGTRTIQIRIDREFRRQQFLDGTELPESYEFHCGLSRLTPAQRQKLWDAGADPRKGVAKRLGGLPLPRYNKGNKQVELRGGTWEARLNPLTSKPEEIFDAWEVDYDKTLEEAQAECEKDAREPGNTVSP